MATTPSGNGGERLGLKVGSHSVDVSVKDLIPILLLVAGAVAGYLVYLALDQRLDQLREVQVHIINELHANRNATLEESHNNQELHVTQMDYFRRLLLAIDHNISHAPSERYPLELLPAPDIAKVPPEPKEPKRVPAP